MCYGEIALSRDFRLLYLLGFNVDRFLCLQLRNHVVISDTRSLAISRSAAIPVL